MYLSRIEITPAIAEHSQLGLILKDRSYGMHRLLWDLFETGERILYREESSQEQLDRPRNLPLYYVLTASKPKATSPLFKVEAKRFDPAIRESDRLGFRLRANPTVSKKDGHSSRSKRHDVVMDAQRQWLLSACSERDLPTEGKKRDLRRRLLAHEDFRWRKGEELLVAKIDEAVQKAARDWLGSRGEKNGFHVVSVSETAYRWNALPEKSRDAGFSSMDYEGVLTVTDPELFKKMLFGGLGPAKAFGCGLMMIRRI